MSNAAAGAAEPEWADPMKADIVARLRVWAHDAALQDALEHCRGLNDAAREIERLREGLSRIAENANDEPYSAEYAKDVLAGRVR